MVYFKFNKKDIISPLFLFMLYCVLSPMTTITLASTFGPPHHHPILQNDHLTPFNLNGLHVSLSHLKQHYPHLLLPRFATMCCCITPVFVDDKLITLSSASSMARPFYNPRLVPKEIFQQQHKLPRCCGRRSSLIINVINIY